MPTVTLLEKVYGSFFVGFFEPVFSSLCKRLRVQVRVVDKTDDNWVKAEVSGEDENVALPYLDHFPRQSLHHSSLEEFKQLIDSKRSNYYLS